MTSTWNIRFYAPCNLQVSLGDTRLQPSHFLLGALCGGLPDLSSLTLGGGLCDFPQRLATQLSGRAGRCWSHLRFGFSLGSWPP